VLEAVTFRSAHGLLAACDLDVGWRDAGAPCPTPEWTRGHHVPVSHTLGKVVDLELTLDLPERAPDAPLVLRGEGPEGVLLVHEGAVRGGVALARSRDPLPQRIQKIAFTVHWSEGGGARLSPRRTANVVYATAGQPRDDRRGDWPEDGVTLKRMDRAVAWVGPLATLDPHAIVAALIAKFPAYALHPSPHVPRRYHHPTYFNEEGGAWPMCDYVAETGECQAIVRLVRAMLRQLGVPGRVRTLLVWADPEVDGGRTALSASWDDDPGAGLDRTRVVDGRTWFAALVDDAVEVGQRYPPSHTPRRGVPSPGLNRFEACLELTYDGRTRTYGGGAGEFGTTQDVLGAFWGLVWVSWTEGHGFRVEEVVTRY
jgi:hypothetical protein